MQKIPFVFAALIGVASFWQDGRGITDITFENVTASGLGLPAAVVAKDDSPLADCAAELFARLPHAPAFGGPAGARPASR